MQSSSYPDFLAEENFDEKSQYFAFRIGGHYGNRFLVTLSQNLVVRTAEVYSFYFNDSSAVSKLYVDFTNNEFADEIVRFMNSWKPDEFQIYEDTGYDMQRILTRMKAII